jgi:hypothetical protein
MARSEGLLNISLRKVTLLNILTQSARFTTVLTVGCAHGLAALEVPMDSDEGLESVRELVLEYIVPLLDEALTAASERHLLAEGRGADGFSYGTDAWSLPSRVFKDRAEERLIPFEVTGPGCVLRLGSTEIRHHRVGESENDDIETSFPNNAKATVSASQLRLFGARDYFGPPREIVLAFMASAEGGLRAVHLARVGRVQDGKIVEWESAVEVWKRQPGESAVSQTPNRAPAEDSPTPRVERTKKRDVEEN